MTNLALAFVLFLCAFLGVVCGFYLGCQYKDRQHWEETYMGDYRAYKKDCKKRK